MNKDSRPLIDASSAFTDASQIFHPPFQMLCTREIDFVTSPQMVRTS